MFKTVQIFSCFSLVDSQHFFCKFRRSNSRNSCPTFVAEEKRSRFSDPETGNDLTVPENRNNFTNSEIGNNRRPEKPERIP